MASHSDMFSTVVDREDPARNPSPPSATRSSPVSASILPTPNPQYQWDAGSSRGYRYPQHKTEPLEASLLPPIRAPSRYGDPSDPTLDFSGLIPMYEHRSPHTRNQLLDLSYNNHEWPPSQYPPTFQRNKPTLWLPPSEGNYPPQHWESPVSGSLVQHMSEYPRFSPPSSSTSSSPPPSYFPSAPPMTAQVSRASSSQRGGANANSDGLKKSCSHCHVTSTPLWRRDPSTQRPLCNACGLYLQQRNKLRPQELIDADDDAPEEPQIPDAEYTGPKCSHCLTRHTSVWRRSKTGAQVCNACGVYARLRGKERPLSLRRNKIKPRTKHSR